MQQIYRRTPMPKCDFNKVAKQLYWNHTSAWVFSCKFAAYFWKPFPKKISKWLLLIPSNSLNIRSAIWRQTLNSLLHLLELTVMCHTADSTTIQASNSWQHSSFTPSLISRLENDSLGLESFENDFMKLKKNVVL